MNSTNKRSNAENQEPNSAQRGETNSSSVHTANGSLRAGGDGGGGREVSDDSMNMEEEVELARTVERDRLRKKYPQASEIGDFLGIFCACGSVLLNLKDSGSYYGSVIYLVDFYYFKIRDIHVVNQYSSISPVNLKALFIVSYLDFSNSVDSFPLNVFQCHSFIPASFNAYALLYNARAELLRISVSEKNEEVFEHLEAIASCASSGNSYQLIQRAHLILKGIADKTTYSKEWYDFWDANTKRFLSIVWDYVAEKLFTHLAKHPDEEGVKDTARMAIGALNEYDFTKYLKLCSEILILLR
jgi:hypothetical protein